MTWEYRVVKRTMKAGEHAPGIPAEDETWLSIHEYFSPADWNGGKGSITVDGMEPQGDTLDELREDLEHMLAALDKPVLRWEDF